MHVRVTILHRRSLIRKSALSGNTLYFPSMSITSLTKLSSLDELKALRPAWEDLSANAVEQNFNYEPAGLLPLLTHVEYPGWFVLTIWSDDKLIGFIPAQIENKIPLPINQFSMLFRHNILSCAPLLRDGYLDEALSVFWRWFNEPRQPKIMRINEVLSRSSVWQAFLKGTTTECGVVDVSDKMVRAVGNTNDLSYEDYFQTNLSAKARGAFRRKKRRIEEDYGNWRTDVLHTGNDIPDRFVNYLIDVEAKSWKYDQGTSLKQQVDVAQFFKEAAALAIHQNRLVVAISFLDEQPVSAMSGFINDGTLWIYKIGYDENYRKYSVGEATMMDLIEHALETADIQAIDSCADPGSELWNRGLPERRDVFYYQLASNHFVSRSALKAVTGSRTLRLKLKKRHQGF